MKFSSKPRVVLTTHDQFFQWNNVFIVLHLSKQSITNFAAQITFQRVTLGKRSLFAFNTPKSGHFPGYVWYMESEQ